MRPRLGAALLAATASLIMLGLAGPGTALAARLVGGSEQAAITRAFDAGHRDQMIVSIRASTANPAWAVVRSVAAPEAGRTTAAGASLKLHSTFYVRAGGSERAGSPPGSALSDLQRPFDIAVVFTGSGGESVAYNQTYRSDCQGAGNFIDTETETVSPMSWTVRYVVDLDQVLAAARSTQGEAVVPNVTFAAGSSALHAVENLTRSMVDSGCNGSTVTYRCTTAFHLGGPDPGGALSFLPGTGLEVGLPLRSFPSGSCNSSDFTLGPSLWDVGGATALVSQLKLIDGRLPGNPYAPVSVSWPTAGAQEADGAASPCQGDADVCSDNFHWRGTVRLEPVS